VVRRDDQPKVLSVVGFSTMQAYNKWGGSNAYSGADGEGSTRASVVSTLRPLNRRAFMATMGFASELEKMTSDVGYLADSDMEVQSRVAGNSNPSVVFFPDHTEYASLAMRSQIELWRDGGSNLAFLSANTLYWPTTPVWSADGQANVSLAFNKELGTFRQLGFDEQMIVGQRKSAYGCNSTAINIPTTPNWLFAGIDPTNIPVGASSIGGEVDSVDVHAPMMPNEKVLAATPLACTSLPNADAIETVTQYVDPSGARVMSIGSTVFPCTVSSFCSGISGSQPSVEWQMIRNIVNMTDHGPAGMSMDVNAVSVPLR